MKPFSTIAIPHKDILEGKLTLDVFAAKLWEVFKGRAIDEYQDSDVFFRKTYLTNGLKNLLDMTDKRLRGKGGNSVIQLQTPFGGGKTHSLIALYHKAKEWKANVAVIVGDVLDPKETIIWEEIERQLTGKIDKLKGKTSPGGEKLRELFIKHQPLLILMDEILEYVIRASGIKVGDSTVASQVLAFMRSLTDVIGTLDKTFLVLTYPSGTHYDESGQKLLNQLQERSGRVEKVYTPVQEEEISSVIRRRLFSNIDEKAAKNIIEKFLEYAEKEKILPKDLGKSGYRDRFVKSYPFQPEVIDTLYKKWGSFYEFGRTRGVLRLLSLIVYSLKETKIPYIRLADFNLGNDEIKRELIKHTGQEYDSILAQDITSSTAGAKKVDKSLGDAYTPFSFGTSVATTIFLYSFSGGPERGASISEVKLSSVEISAPSSIVVEAVSKLKDNLFYLSDKELIFTNRPNLNRILLNKIGNIGDKELREEEKIVLGSSLQKEHFELFVWPNTSKDVPNTKGLKLVVMQEQDERKCKEFLERCGERPRVYPNVLVFLCPMKSERTNFEEFLRRKLAWQLVERDETLHMTSEQKKDVKDRVRKTESEVKDRARNLYRLVLLPSRDGFKDIDLGIPTYGTEITITKEIYERLRIDNEILAKYSPLSLKERYLKDKEYVETKKILESFFTTPGEIRIVSDDVLRDCVTEGVKQGLFGVGNMEKEKPISRYFKEEFSPELVEGEILISAELCKPKEKISDEKFQIYIEKMRQVKTMKSLDEAVQEIPLDNLTIEQERKIESEINKKRDGLKGITSLKEKYSWIHFKLNIPSGKLSDMVRLVNYIRNKFNKVNVKVEVSAQEGEMAKSDYEDKVKEGINQANITVEKEEVE